MLRGEALCKARNLVYLFLIATVSVFMTAQDTGAAIVRSSGTVLINKSPASATSTLFPGDRIETENNAIARIELAGSAADINPETVLQYESDELFLDHGSLSVNTARGLKVHAGCVTVTPVQLMPTHYEVSDVDGRVHVSALKDDVYIESRSSKTQTAKQSTHSDRDIVREGQQKSRDEKCGGGILRQSRVPDGSGPIMSSPYAIGTAAGVVLGVGCWALCRGDDPISPDHP